MERYDSSSNIEPPDILIIDDDRAISRRVTIDSQTGEMVSFEIARLVKLDGEWWPVVRWSGEGGKVTQDIFPKKNRTPINQPNHFADVNDVHEGLGIAEARAADASWESHTRRYLIG